MPHAPVDVLILGAGLSGIGAGCHLRRQCPDKSFAILERRENIGGTWDLFRYPGIRSDSDMYTMGYRFKPWTGTTVLADGDSIREYIREAADEYQLTDKIQFGLAIEKADWNSEQSLWTVTSRHEASGETIQHQARFVIFCTGYYNYDEGYQPDFPGQQDFAGQWLHPQKWPEGLDYQGKKVVIIGSGATAVTLVPNMAEQAEHVTMLQRSPTYIVSVPATDPITPLLAKFLPSRWVYKLGRFKNIGLMWLFFRACRAFPSMARKLILRKVRQQVSNDTKMRHFEPSYKPWDQRVCAVPDGDLFTAIESGKATIVTDHIDQITSNGIRLKSGTELTADIIVSATGLRLELLGGIEISVDGQHQPVNDSMAYRSVLIKDVPNLAYIFGYTNASWTLKADLACEYICRLLKHMDKTNSQQVTPRGDDSLASDKALLDLEAGYIQRGKDKLPKQGTKAPWQVLDNYLLDAPILRHGKIDDGTLEFRA